WGVGPVIVPPTATSSKVGSNIWGAGPTAVALRIDGPWVYGALVNNVWSFAGTSGPGGAGNAYNSFLLQPFVNYNFGEGWYVNTAPILTSNWLAPAGQQWVVRVAGDDDRGLLKRRQDRGHFGDRSEPPAEAFASRPTGTAIRCLR